MTPLRLTPSGGSATTLAVESLSWGSNIDERTKRDSGLPFASLSVVHAYAPQIEFSTPFAGAYTVFGGALKKLTAVDVFNRTFADFLLESTGDKWGLRVGAEAVGFINRIEFADDILMAQCVIMYLAPDDGMTNPIDAVAAAQAIPTLSANPACHSLGPIHGPGGEILGLNSFSLNMGQRLLSGHTDGDKYLRNVRYDGGLRQLEIPHSGVRELLTEVGLDGLSFSSPFVQYAREIDPVTGAKHASNAVSFSIGAGRASLGSVSKSVGASDEVPLMITALNASRNEDDPLAVSLSATVP
jgi:hypothetical protein